MKRVLLIALLLTGLAHSETSSRELEVPGPYPMGATLEYPTGRGPFPGVVLMHGSGPNDRDESIPVGLITLRPFKKLSSKLADRGVVVLRYDKRTRVMLKDPTHADFQNVVPLDFVEDAVAALKLLRSQPEVDPDRIFIIAHSQGGTLAPWVADRMPLAGVILLAPALLPMRDQIDYQINYQVEVMQKLNSLGSMNSKIAETKRVGKQFQDIYTQIDSGKLKPTDMVGGASVAFFRESDRLGGLAVEKIAALKPPTLLINGTEDLKCPAPLLQTKELQLKRNPNLSLVYQKGMVHELYRQGYLTFESVIVTTIYEWIKAQSN